MRKFSIAAAIMFAAALPASAEARCSTHKCWHRIHINRVEHYVEKKIDAITPYGPCFGGRWAVPCGIIDTESNGSWTVVNSQGSGALGPYQFLGWPVPWPVIVANKLQTLKNKLAHHRMARALWGQQVAGAACHWCY